MSWLKRILFFMSMISFSLGAERSQRSFTFLDGSGAGYFAAVVLPLQSTVEPVKVYHSYLIETVHFFPDVKYFSLLDDTPLKTRVDGRKRREAPKKLRLPTRKHTYRMIVEQLERWGYNGTACLLKTICQTAEAGVYENNGLIGDLFHIVFTPSSSRDEGLPKFIYEAEHLGSSGESCDHEYSETCPSSLIEMISDL